MTVQGHAIHRKRPLGSTEDFDPILLAVIANRLDAVVREMTNTLLRTGRSAMLAIARDFSCSIVTGDDRLLATAEGTPVHILGSHIQSATIKLQHPNYEEGDAFLHNDPYLGNTHAADHTILVPVFFQGEHLFTVCPKAHQADCGNSIPTTYHAWARDVYEEGALIFPCVKVESRHRQIDDIIRMCRARIRVPDQWYGDYLACLGAARIGETRLKELAYKYGAQTLSAFNEAWFEYGKRMFQAAVEELPERTISRSIRHDAISDLLPDGFEIRATIEILPSSGRIRIDLRDNEDCMPNGMNVSRTCALNSAVTGILNALPADIPRNAGMLECIEVLVRNGSAIGGPTFPHSCAVATTNLSDRIVNVVQAAMAELGGRVGTAEGGVGMGVGAAVISGNDRRRSGHPFVNQLLASSASGPASGFADGWLTYSIPVGSGMCYRDSVEIDEWRHPILFDHIRILPGTGGAGEFRGAPSSDVCYGPRFDPLDVIVAADGHVYKSAGVVGGDSGVAGESYLIDVDGTRHRLDTAFKCRVKPGQKVQGVESSGGGYGDPLRRDPELVLFDILNGFETLARASAVYGVVIVGSVENDNLRVDYAATERQRLQRGAL
jgi:N-methylhydantoinase B